MSARAEAPGAAGMPEATGGATGTGNETGQVRAVDLLIAVYNAALAVLWAAHVSASGAGAGAADGATVACLVHAVGALLPMVIASLPERLPVPARIAREAYPLLLLPVFWLELNAVIRLVHGTTYDAAIMALDRAVFGLHLDRVWMPAMPQVWFSELMHFSYWIYLPLIFTPPIVMALRRDGAAFRDVSLRLMATYIGCYVVYLVFPTAGPKAFGVPFEGGALSDGFFFGLVARAHETGNVYGAAFPSSHVAGAVTVAWLGWRWFSPRTAVLLSVQAAGVVMSTVYTQNHYAVDSVAGILFALSIQTWLVPALSRLESSVAGRREGTRARREVPPLAVPPLPERAR